jgi:hypothetical protein
VAQHIFVLATTILESISQNRHSVEGTVGVDVSGKSQNGGRAPRRVFALKSLFNGGNLPKTVGAV